ncbi:hypothetical protein MAR_024190 [Mya arenaria]|uniref:Uncharacterized protein n=1 Tax=Mya arenaria TaxID=6604 RepID=A0ABY7DQ37_MYAAR|nr:hypothetical protein MAR_024190 [Mya arenaria]
MKTSHAHRNGEKVPKPPGWTRQSHSRLSKYLTECKDYILKTKHTLSPYMSLKEQARYVVNANVGLVKTKTKAADVQMENEVKLLKTLTCGN